MAKVGAGPSFHGHYDFNLPEMMYYLYLPVWMEGECIEWGRGLQMPPNLEACRTLIHAAIQAVGAKRFRYVYLSARKGWATKDNPLNRPGWHCDGFGTDDMNFVWWRGPGTRFAAQRFVDISDDHVLSQQQFEEQVDLSRVFSPPEAGLYGISPEVVHATPVIGDPGCLRQYIKISLSNERYNLENNSHNWLFDYSWPLHSRDMVRNDPHKAQGDAA